MLECGADPHIIGEHTQKLKALEQNTTELWGEIKDFRKENKDEIRELTIAIKDLVKSYDENSTRRISKLEDDMMILMKLVPITYDNQEFIKWISRGLLASGAGTLAFMVMKHVNGG